MTDLERAAKTRRESRRIVNGLLSRVRRRWRTVASMSAASRAGLAATVVILVAALVDWLGHPADLLLVALVSVAAASAIGLGVWLLWPARRRPTDRQVARYIEEHHPDLEDRLTSATAEGDAADASAFHDLVLADAARRAPAIDASSIVRDRAVRAAVGGAVGTLAILVIALLVARDPAARALQVVWLYAFPSSVTLDVLPGDARVVAGQPLTITATVRGGVGAAGGARPVVTLDEGGEPLEVEMQAAGDSFRLELPEVGGSFSYRVSAASAESPVFEITALHPPRVERIDVHYDYPAFTGLEPRVEEDGGDIYAPAGTTIRMQVHTDKPIDQASLDMGDGTSTGLVAAAERMLEAELHVDSDGSYRIGLLDRDGLRSSGDTEYFIRVMDDRPPEVHIMRPGADRQITSLEEVSIEARADDDYGVADFELVYSVRGGAERVVPIGPASGTPAVTGMHMLYVEDLGVEPGDFVTYYARARDVSRAKRSTETRSDIFFLEIKPFEEEFVAAQSQSMMGGGGGGSLNELVDAQKEVIVATWKLERRSTAGSSPEDVRAIARAQGELRDRTVAAASEMGGRGRRRGRTADADDDGSPLQLAAEAMGRAREALDALNVAEALPGEMEALNQLLKAQAEIRRRQVARQQSGGGGGGGSGAQQDLSALFDRELQRQQETNYETPQSPASASQEEESEALRRVRELARRQDELGRRQRELARQQDELAPEELRRRLERLTREQSELRQHAEDLSRELARQAESQQARSQRDEQGWQQGGQSTQQSGDSSQRGQQAGQEASNGSNAAGNAGQTGGGRMREISDEMQRAASELRREDPAQASEQADRALAGLRELERRLLGGEPEQQQRALGELQLESQQVARAQHRLAGEAERLGSGPSTAASRERLASEKDRLAERVDDLERRLAALGRNLDETQSEALARAVDRLDEERVSARMRESAAALREAGGDADQRRDGGAVLGEESGAGSRPAGAGGAEPDDPAARALDPRRMAADDERLAETLDEVAREIAQVSDPADPEAQRLSEQLARSGELRDRLRSLQEQMRQLEQSAEAGQAGADTSGGSERAGQPGRAAGERGAGDVADLQAEYREQLQETMELLEQLQAENPQMGGGRGTPEEHRYSVSAPGTQAFKQDYAAWESLRRDIESALEELEASLSSRLSQKETEDRMNAGTVPRLPEDYRRLVSEYYQALAAKKRN